MTYAGFPCMVQPQPTKHTGADTCEHPFVLSWARVKARVWVSVTVTGPCIDSGAVLGDHRRVTGQLASCQCHLHRPYGDVWEKRASDWPASIANSCPRYTAPTSSCFFSSCSPLSSPSPPAIISRCLQGHQSSAPLSAFYTLR